VSKAYVPSLRPIISLPGSDVTLIPVFDDGSDGIKEEGDIPDERRAIVPMPKKTRTPRMVKRRDRQFLLRI
jgi:hypothetical protein